MEADSAFSLRPYRESDLNFIQNSWGTSYYKGADYVLFMSPKEFHAQHRPIRDKILKKPSAVAIVACDPNDEDLILGWILVEKPPTEGLILHYLYVKEAFKGEGISEELIKKALPDRPIFVSHMTDKARKIIGKKKKYFKDFYYAIDPIMIRDKYLYALPREEQWFLENGNE